MSAAHLERVVKAPAAHCCCHSTTGPHQAHVQHSEGPFGGGGAEGSYNCSDNSPVKDTTPQLTFSLLLSVCLKRQGEGDGSSRQQPRARQRTAYSLQRRQQLNDGRAFLQQWLPCIWSAHLKGSVLQVKEVEAAAERAAAQSAAVIEEAMAQAEEARRRAEQDTQSRVRATSRA